LANFPEGKHEEARKFFKQWKKDNKDRLGLLTLSGKVDSKRQRRWQCSINKTNYKKLFGERAKSTIFNGIDLSEFTITSGKRKFIR
jgi:hypothetical protein